LRSRHVEGADACSSPWITAELRGIPSLPLEPAPPPRRSLVVSRAFGRKLTAFEPVKEALVAHVARAAEKLRREQRAARHLSVFLHTSPFAAAKAYYAQSIGIGPPDLTSDTAELIGHDTAALRRIYRPGPHYAKCDVMLTELTPEGDGQADLLDTRDTARRCWLMTALDALNRRLGRDTVFSAGAGIRRYWAAIATRKSRLITTDWQEVLKVRA
jgi:DNA polymerase V